MDKVFLMNLAAELSALKRVVITTPEMKERFEKLRDEILLEMEAEEQAKLDSLSNNSNKSL